MSFEEFLENPDFLLKNIGDEDQSCLASILKSHRGTPWHPMAPHGDLLDPGLAMAALGEMLGCSGCSARQIVNSCEFSKAACCELPPEDTWRSS